MPPELRANSRDSVSSTVNVTEFMKRGVSTDFKSSRVWIVLFEVLAPGGIVG